ncbi:MAG: TonB C-terminal domain-containing protein [Deltaproteobacteria bacterium]|nr:TonB C-terminal domain-containing protein [Deltaproteobacteria bacterium]
MTADKPKKVPPPRPVPVSLLVTSRFSDELFWRGFKTSASAHAVLALFAIAMGIALPHSPVKFLPSIRVDLVALPDVKKSDLGKVQPRVDDVSDLSKQLHDAAQLTKTLTDKAKKIPSPPPTPDEMIKVEKDKPKPKPDSAATKEAERKKALRNAIDRIAALDEIAKDDKPAHPKPKAAAKGNKLSNGDSTSGGAAIDTNQFISKMTGRLRDNWNLPVWLSKQNLDAKVVVFLDRAGYVNNTIMAKSSGNKQFDAFCLQTIRMAQPFGEPPADILSDGLTLGFPL